MLAKFYFSHYGLQHVHSMLEHKSRITSWCERERPQNFFRENHSLASIDPSINLLKPLERPSSVMWDYLTPVSTPWNEDPGAVFVRFPRIDSVSRVSFSRIARFSIFPCTRQPCFHSPELSVVQSRICRVNSPCENPL